MRPKRFSAHGPTIRFTFGVEDSRLERSVARPLVVCYSDHACRLDALCRLLVIVGAWLSLARAPGSGPGGRWFKSTRPDQFFQSLTPPRFPPDWVHLGPTSASRVPLPLQFAHEIQDASVYSAMLSANWNDQSILSPNPQGRRFL
jgi:hypothetical protein